jgi:hypothetical protein
VLHTGDADALLADPDMGRLFFGGTAPQAAEHDLEQPE